MSIKRVYTWLLVTSLIIFGLEIWELFHGHGHRIVIMDLGHIFAHLFVATIALIFLINQKKLGPLRLWFLLFLILGTSISLIMSLMPNHDHNHVHHPLLLVVIGVISFIQHRVSHRHHDHTDGHDMLCNGIKWHFASDTVKSFCFAGIGFGLSSNILTMIAYTATIFGLLAMMRVTFKEIRK